MNNPRRSRPLLRLALAATVAVAACRSKTVSAPLLASSAVVFGRVTSSSDAPVVGQQLRVVVFRSLCSGAADVMAQVATEADGLYRAELRSAVSPMTSCVAVRYVPPAQSDTVTLVGGNLHFGYGDPTDSVRIDVRLP